MHDVALPAPLSPELIGAGNAATLSGVSRSTWWTLHSAGCVPEPVRLGGRTLWRRRELLAWIDAGCPSRNRWQWTEGQE